MAAKLTTSRAVTRDALTPDFFHKAFTYDPETGEVRRRALYPGLQPARLRKRVGSVATNGYLVTTIHGYEFAMHRIAWLLAMGDWPVANIDHINGNRADNRLANLRELSPKGNVENQRRAHHGSKSGFLGVEPHHGRWRAKIKVDGRPVLLGRFDTPQEAHAAYLEAKRRLHAGCTI